MEWKHPGTFMVLLHLYPCLPHQAGKYLNIFLCPSGNFISHFEEMVSHPPSLLPSWDINKIYIYT